MGSVRRRGVVVRVDLDHAEVVLLASLVGQVRSLLVDGLPDSAAAEDPLQALVGLPPADIDSDVDRPADPVLARLLPDAYRDDPAAAREYRRLMDSDLRTQKAAALDRVLGDLSGRGTGRGNGGQRYELDDEAVTPWLYALTDVRLALGTTLDVTEDMDADRAALEPGSPRSAGLAVYDWVTWLQDALVRAANG